MAAIARHLDALAQMRHVAVEAEHLVAMAQALALRVHQEQDRPLRMRADGGEHFARHGETDLDADLGVMRGAEHGEGVRAATAAADEQIALLDDLEALREQLAGDRSPRWRSALLRVDSCASIKRRAARAPARGTGRWRRGARPPGDATPARATRRARRARPPKRLEPMREHGLFLFHGVERQRRLDGDQSRQRMRGTRPGRRRRARRNRRAGSDACRRWCATPARDRASRIPRRRCAVSITSGPDRPSRPSSLMTIALQQATRCPCRRSSRIAPPISADHAECRRRARRERAHHLRHGDQPGVGFVQAHAAGLEQQQHGGGALAHGALQQADDLGAVHFADGAAHEAAFLRGDAARAAPASVPLPTTTPSSKATGRSSALQMRADDALAAAAGIRANAAGVEHARRRARARSLRSSCASCGSSVAGAARVFLDRLVEAQADHRRRRAHVVDGDAHVRQLHGARRSRRAPPPRSRRSRAPRCRCRSCRRRRARAGSISTSRLPEPTTPTSAARAGAARGRLRIDSARCSIDVAPTSCGSASAGRTGRPTRAPGP